QAAGRGANGAVQNATLDGVDCGNGLAHSLVLVEKKSSGKRGAWISPYRRAREATCFVSRSACSWGAGSTIVGNLVSCLILARRASKRSPSGNCERSNSTRKAFLNGQGLKKVTCKPPALPNLAKTFFRSSSDQPRASTPACPSVISLISRGKTYSPS